MKILLVDDDIFLRDMYVTKFGEHGDVVKSVEDGKQALTLLGTESFDIIVMDMVMPGMSGVELLKEIKDRNIAPNTKCIVLSNQGEESDIKAAYAQGAVGYIIKAALIPSEVVQKVHTIVS